MSISPNGGSTPRRASTVSPLRLITALSAAIATIAISIGATDRRRSRPIPARPAAPAIAPSSTSSSAGWARITALASSPSA